MEDGQVGRMLLMLSAVKVVGQVLRHRSTVVPIQYRSAEVKPVREQTTEKLPVMNSVAQVCAYLHTQLHTSLAILCLSSTNWCLRPFPNLV